MRMMHADTNTGCLFSNSLPSASSSYSLLSSAAEKQVGYALAFVQHAAVRLCQPSHLLV